MKRLIAWLAACLTLVAAIALVAALWVHNNHTRTIDTRVVLIIRGSHGIHVVDLIVLGIELALAAALVLTLVAGYRRR